MLAAAGDWTSLEAVKLFVGVLTPIAVVLIGWQLTKVGRRIEDVQWATRTLVERRLELHREMAPKLNDLLYFFTWVGDFRALDPPKVHAIKRELDRAFFTNEHLFGTDL